MSVSGSVKMLKSASCNLSDSGSTRSTRFRFLSWSPDTHSIREFINLFPLPRVVRVTNCEEANIAKALVLPSDVDITQPLLLYKKYRPVKVIGKCLKVQKSGKWKEVGPSLVIPDSFPGWFSLLNQEGKECAMTLTSMGQVAAARVPAFLTKFDVPVYKLTDSNEPGGKSVYVRSTMKAGSILRLLGVWADLGGANKGFSYPQKTSGFLGGSLGGFGGRLVARTLSSGPQGPQFQYVQCLSLENEVLFIPFSATGVFYPIAPRGGRNPQHIYPLSAIARTHRLPLKTKMVYGTFPNNLSDFTGTLQIESVDTEDVILACTLLKDKPCLFEIDVDCELLLSQMTSEDLFIKSTSYQSALTFCRSEGDNWKRQIRPSLFGNATKGGTVTGSFLLSTKNSGNSSSCNKSMRIRSSPPPPSKLSLLFRPTSTPFSSTKDPLRRSKSFNVEIQSVSISLTQDEEEEETKKLSTLFNFMKGKNKKQTQQHQQQHQQQQQLQLQQQDMEKDKKCLSSCSPHQLSHQQNHTHIHPHQQHHNQSVPDVLSNHNRHHQHNHHSRPPNSICNSNHVTTIHCGNSKNNNSYSSNNGEVPYGTVLDDVTEEENIYAEISDALTLKLSLNPIHQMGINFHHQLHRHQSASNMSSLVKGGGGSDGAFSGTLSGTFSSSNPSNREEDIYDSVF